MPAPVGVASRRALLGGDDEGPKKKVEEMGRTKEVYEGSKEEILETAAAEWQLVVRAIGHGRWS